MQASRGQYVCVRLRFSARLLAVNSSAARATKGLTTLTPLRKAAAASFVRHRSLCALSHQQVRVLFAVVHTGCLLCITSGFLLRGARAWPLPQSIDKPHFCDHSKLWGLGEHHAACIRLKVIKQCTSKKILNQCLAVFGTQATW